MKISNQLPQFEDENVLLVVAGETIAKIYFASQKEINELEVIEPHAAEYPDEQGFNIQSGHGQSFTWQSFNINDEWRQKEFLNFFKNRIKYLINQSEVDKIYLVAPKEDIRLIKRVIPKDEQGKIKLEIKKNLVNERPFKILELIKRKEEEGLGNKVPMKKEARKILGQ